MSLTLRQILKEKREKQINEMAKIIENAFKVYFGANDLVEPEDFPYQAKDLAKELLEHYQPKLPEDSVVLSREEYEKYQNFKRDVEHSFEYNQGYTDGQIYGSKETAEKYHNEIEILIRTCMCMHYISLEHGRWFLNDNDKLAKSLGVEIKG